MTGSEAGSLLSAMGRHLEEVLGRASQGGDASEDASSEALRDAVYLLLNELEGVNRPKALQAIQSHGFSCARDKSLQRRGRTPDLEALESHVMVYRND